MYGIELKYKNGGVSYLGSGCHFLHKNSNMKIKWIDGAEYIVNRLDESLIQKYGYKSLDGAQRGFNTKLIKRIIADALRKDALESASVVELNTSLETKTNWSKMLEALNS